MESRGDGTSVSISWIQPPYVRLEPLRARADDRLASVPFGSIGALVVADAPATMIALDRAVPLLRRRFPNLPFVLCVREGTARSIAEIAFHAQALHLRAVVVDAAPLSPSLRAAMTAPVDLGADVTEWLPLRGVRLQPALAEIVSCVFRSVALNRRADALLGISVHSDRTARAQCRKAGVVSPSAWFQLARAIAAILRLQQDPQASLLRVALAVGYHDQSGLIHQVERLFALRPAIARGLLGWEWLLDRWVTRAIAHASPPTPIPPDLAVSRAASPADFDTARRR